MLPRFHAKDFLTVGHYLGVLLVINGSLMFVPALVAALYQEQAQASVFVFGAGLSLLAGSVLRLLKAARLDRRRSLLLCGFAWVLVAAFAAVPMYLSEEFSSFLAAFFDSVSVLTSTGVTSLMDVEHMSHAQSTWRAVLSLAGGQAIIVTALYLGFFGDGGYSARENARARHDSIATALRSTGALLWRIMLAIVLIGLVVVAAILALNGMPLSDAIANGFWLAGTAFSTGSFIPHSSSLVFYHSTALNGVMGVLMILGSLNFAILAIAVTQAETSVKVIAKNSELRAYALWLFLLVVAVSVVICRDNIFAGWESLFNRSTFMVVSSATTTGMQTVYPGQMGESFPASALIIIMAAMFVGGCSGSTSGGLKVFRALQVFRWFGQSVQRSLFPDSVQVFARYNHFGTKRATPEDAMLAMVVTTMFVIAAAVGAALFIAHGYSAVDAICESISYVTNTGVSVERPAGSMDSGLMLFSMLLMWAGRLEFIALIAAFASVVTSARPQRNVIPDGVVSSRKAQRKERRRRRAKRVGKLLDPKGRAAKVLALIAVVSLAVCAPPQAQALLDGEQPEASQQLQVEESYRNTTVGELTRATERMDGELVKVSGEVVGCALNADKSHVWVNIQGESGYTIGVLMTRTAVTNIENFGGYGTVGDTVEVLGSYNQMCDAHGGQLEIHAGSVEVTQSGYAVSHGYDGKLGLGGVLMVLLSIILTLTERLWRGKRYVRILGRNL